MKKLKLTTHMAMVLIMMICACHEVPSRNSKKHLDENNTPEISPERIGEKSPTLICDLRDNFDQTTVEFVKKNSLAIISSIEKRSENEMCLLGLIDSISHAAHGDNSMSYFMALDSLAQKGDGFLGEYLDETCRELFYKNFADFSGYLSRYPNSNLRDFVQTGLSSAFSTIEVGKRNDALQSMKSSFEKRIKEESLSPETAEMVRSILQKVNPNLLD